MFSLESFETNQEEDWNWEKGHNDWEGSVHSGSVQLVKALMAKRPTHRGFHNPSGTALCEGVTDIPEKKKNLHAYVCHDTISSFSSWTFIEDHLLGSYLERMKTLQLIP